MGGGSGVAGMARAIPEFSGGMALPVSGKTVFTVILFLKITL
jgi:hypothetical protein